MARFLTRMRAGPRAAAWATSSFLTILSCTHVPAFADDSAFLRGLSSGGTLYVVSASRKLETSENEDPIVALCKTFHLSRDQIRRYMRLARPITASEFDHAQDWLPCVVTGEAVIGGKRFEWTISASGAGKLRGIRSSDVVFVSCEEQCRAAALGEK
jgi:hypothetical protein